MYSARQEFLVGLFVIFGVFSLFFASFQVSGMSDLVTRPGYEVFVQFENIGTLRQRAAVNASGVLVGRVSDLGYDAKEYRAWVRLSIDNDFRFPVDSTASIRTSGLLGEQYVNIEPGVEDELLEAGDYFYNSESAMVLEDLINQIAGAVLDE